MLHAVGPSLRTLLALGVLGLVCLAEPEMANAGFICAQPTMETGFDEAMGDAGMAAPTAPAKPIPFRQIDDPVPTADDNAAGMAPPSSSAPTAPVVAAILPDPVQASAQLAAWLGPQGRVWLPPPFSTGIFRPPRSVA